MSKRPNKYPTQTADRKREIQLIKIAQKQLNMADDTYRDMLWAVARVKSSTELDFAGRKKVLEHLEACGWKRSKPQPRKLADDPESRKVRALWLLLHDLGAVKNPSESALAAYVQRMTKVSDLHWISGTQMETVIESLKKWANRYLPAKVQEMALQLQARIVSEALQLAPEDEMQLTGLVSFAQARGTFDPMQAAYEELKKWLAR